MQASWQQYMMLATLRLGEQKQLDGTRQHFVDTFVLCRVSLPLRSRGCHSSKAVALFFLEER